MGCFVADENFIMKSSSGQVVGREMCFCAKVAENGLSCRFPIVLSTTIVTQSLCVIFLKFSLGRLNNISGL